MKLAIIGTRTFNDFNLVEEEIKPELKNIECIITGGAMGTDTLAERIAQKYNISIIIFKPDWKRYGKGAGLKRNKTIIKNADTVLAFWNGESKGTKNSIELAKKFNKELKIIYI